MLLIAPTSIPRPLQPAPNNAGVQPAPQNKTPSANTHSRRAAKPKPKPAATAESHGIDGAGHAAKDHPSAYTNPSHDFFDYLGLILPFLVGVVTVAVLVLQLCLLRRADMIAVLDAKIAGRQMRISSALADIAVAQKEIARQEYLVAHRPRIAALAFRPRLEGQNAGAKYLAEFIILNEGETTARVVEVGTAVFSGPGPWNYGARKVRFEIEINPFSLIGGQPKTIATKSRFPMTENDLVPSKERGVYWFCIGYIKYRAEGDDFDRATGFCRVWDFKSMIWERWPSEEYEYAY